MPAIAATEALRHNRAVREAYVDLSLMFLEMGQPEEALRSVERVLEASPQDHDALVARARCLATLGRASSSTANDSLALLETTGDHFTKCGDPDEAYRAYLQAWQELDDPGFDPKLHAMRERLHLKMKSLGFDPS